MNNVQPRRRRNGLYIAGTVFTALTAIATAIFSINTSKASTPAAAAAPAATPVSVATVVQSDVATWDEFSGRLEAVERVDIRSRVAGTVQSVHFREGALVKKGDLLITIDPAPYQADVDRAAAQVAAAEARVSYTHSESERAKRQRGSASTPGVSSGLAGWHEADAIRGIEAGQAPRGPPGHGGVQ